MYKREINQEEAKSSAGRKISSLISSLGEDDHSPHSWFSKETKLDLSSLKEAAADARRFEVQPGVVAICPKHGAEIIETETHFRPKTSASQDVKSISLVKYRNEK